jgi:hypothetical protein
MKLLLLPLLLAGVGAGWYGVDARAAAEDCAADCRMTVECIGDDTCLVTCYEPDGSIRCQEELTCDEPCERPCDTPCDVACDRPCDRMSEGAAATASGTATTVPAQADATSACAPSPACLPSPTCAK